MLERLAALSAAIAIAAGAFGVHRFTGKEAEWLRTGGLYQLMHAVAVIALARWATPGPLWVLLGGATLFAATLYAMAFGAPRMLGAVTPVGGALMIAGWLWLAWTTR
jgi:uncharacterized membrane protein YgdD (TMEM256/DUF423 family)